LIPDRGFVSRRRARQLVTIVLMRFGTSPTGIDLTNFMFGASTTEIEREPALEM
jgi:hypothetical protein